MSRRLGIDSGGTFTDFVVLDGDDRSTHKSPSTPHDPSEAVLNGIAELAELAGLPVDEYVAGIDVIVHGTTVATNALLTGGGAPVGLLCSEGWRDVLALRDGTREDPYDNAMPKPQPLVPRRLRIPVRGRLDAFGGELRPLVLDDVRDAAEVFGRAGVEVVAVSLLHSWVDDAHEQTVAALLAELLPGVDVVRSSALLPLLGYTDRTSTTVINAALTPVIRHYLDSLIERLARVGFDGTLVMMQSNGGVAAVEEVRDAAARLVLSGPAGAPVGGLETVSELGFDGCVTADMGGTSFDCAMVKDGRALTKTDGMVGRARIALPMLDIHTVGAGGGSIASVTSARLLKVGPESAGARPGPACYGRGGVLPTVTDADLVLGYLDPERFLDGRMALDVDAAHRAVTDHVAGPLGIDTVAAAAGIFRLVNVAMATGIREVTLERGLDPREYPLVVAGGAGAVHAAAIAAELGMRTIVIPSDASVFCAAGMLAADFQHDFVRSHHATLERLDPAFLRDAWQDMRRSGFERLSLERVEPGRAAARPTLDLRYIGQFFELDVHLPEAMIDEPDVGEIRHEFHRLHERLFGFCSPEAEIEVLNIRLEVVGASAVARRLRPTAPIDEARHEVHLGERECWSPERGGMVMVPVLDGRGISPVDRFSGPAIIELASTAAVVPTDFEILCDHYGSLILCRPSEVGRMAEMIERQVTPVA